MRTVNRSRWLVIFAVVVLVVVVFVVRAVISGPQRTGPEHPIVDMPSEIRSP
jgi:ABC-type transporter Mla subunit MlaD